jgi:flavoprotein
MVIAVLLVVVGLVSPTTTNSTAKNSGSLYDTLLSYTVVGEMLELRQVLILSISQFPTNRTSAKICIEIEIVRPPGFK